jgi:basic membrane protein A and related proteins
MWAAAALATAAITAVGFTGTGAAAPVAPKALTGGTLKVALVTDIGGLNDKSFNFLANKGLQQAKRQLGVDVTVKQSNKPSDYIPNLSGFGRQRYDLVVAVGFLMEESVAKVSKQFPQTKYAIIDSSVGGKIKKQKNTTGLLFAEQQAGYLVGYLAGLVTAEAGDRANPGLVVSSVGGVPIPPVDRYIAGFQAGAKKANKGVTTLNGYSNEFVAQDKCQNLAKSQIDQGSDIVFQVAGGCGIGALNAAKTAGVWGIGVDANQASQGSHILASAVKRVDQAVFLTVQSLKAGKFAGGKDRVFDLKVNGVGIEGINAKAARYKAQVNKIAADIKAGKIKIPTTVSDT